MKRQPITQKAKSSPFHVNEALISGAAQTSRRFVNPMGGNDDDPDNPKMTRTKQGEGRTETIRTGGDRPVEELADSDTFFKQMAAEAEARGWKGSVQDYIKQKEESLGYKPKQEERNIPGKTITEEMPYYKKELTDVLTSPETRKVGRKGNYMNRQSGKLAKQQANLKSRLYEKGDRKLEKLKEKLSKAKDGSRRQENLQKRIKNFESELERNPSYQRLKKKLEATEESAKAFDNFRSAQNEATSRGKSFGRRDVGYGSQEMSSSDFSIAKQEELFNRRPINNSNTVGQGQTADNIRSFSSKYDPNYDLSGYSVFNDNGLGKTITPSNSTKTTIPESFTDFISKERMKKGGSGINMNSKSAFKMKGYGKKTYKK